MKKEQKEQITTKPSNVLYTLLGVLRKYLFPILGIIGLIVGNVICFNINNRFLTLPTNLIWCFMIVGMLIKPRK